MIKILGPISGSPSESSNVTRKIVCLAQQEGKADDENVMITPVLCLGVHLSSGGQCSTGLSSAGRQVGLDHNKSVDPGPPPDQQQHRQAGLKGPRWKSILGRKDVQFRKDFLILKKRRLSALLEIVFCLSSWSMAY